MSPLTYITGTPGSGKTLLTITLVTRLLSDLTEEDPPRPVFYFNIPGVDPSLGWTELTREQVYKVHELPTGAIVIIDEAWEFFPQRGPSNPVPEFIEHYSRLRHRGHTVLLISQRISSIDHYMRGLVGCHYHLVRKFGLQSSNLYHYEGGVGDPKDKNDVPASKTRFNFPKSLYGKYKSADLHTVKRKLPKGKIALGVGILVVLVGSVTTVFAWLGSSADDRIASVTPGSEGEVPSTEVSGIQRPVNDPMASAEMDARNHILDSYRYAQEFRERIPGQPLTAPFYDPAVDVRSVPRVSGCMHVVIGQDSRCTCNTQQGARIRSITHQMCLRLLEDGWHDWSREPQQERYQDPQSAEPVLVDSGS